MTGEDSSPPLADLHSHADERGVHLSEVGVRGVAARLTVEDPGAQHGPLPARLSLSVALLAHQRGAHLSRFGEAIASWNERLRLQDLPAICEGLAGRFESPFAKLEGSFPLLVERRAPVSGSAGLIELQAGFAGMAGEGLRRPMGGGAEVEASPARSLTQRLTAFVQTVCPCSKAISEQGAHNQRCQVTVEVRSPEGLSYLELHRAIERAGSCEVYPVLKRPDEKHVTERAYAHPAFVEDVAREIARALDLWPNVRGYRIEVVSQESIHPHDAYAIAEKRC